MSRADGTILVVSSVGGHLAEVMTVVEHLRHRRVVLVVNDEAQLPGFPFARVYRIAHAERDWRVVLNFLEAAYILLRESPTVILSTGAGLVVPFALLARLIGNVRVIYVESAAAVARPTLTGRLVYPLAHDFFYQWPQLARFFPRGELARVVFG